jgi:hypothetical protein
VLAKLDTLGDYELAKTLISQYSFPNKQAWIGLNDLSQEGTFRWVEDDSELGAFSKWCAPNPNNLNNEDCVVMNGNAPNCAGGMWFDVGCATAKNMAVCRVPGPAPPLDTHLALLTSEVSFIYSAAKSRCGRLLGGVLAKISNQAEYDEVAELIAASTAASKQAWIGLNDIDVEKTFRFVEDNSVLGGFQVSVYIFMLHGDLVQFILQVHGHIMKEFAGYRMSGRTSRESSEGFPK